MIKEDLKNYQLKDLILVKNIIRYYPNLKACEIIDAIKEEESRRKIIDLTPIQIHEKFCGNYIKLDYNDGLGGYEVWKVRDILDSGKNTYTLSPDCPVVSNINGIYTIDSYTEQYIIDSISSLNSLTVINEDEFNKEFENAIDYYKSLKK